MTSRDYNGLIYQARETASDCEDDARWAPPERARWDPPELAPLFRDLATDITVLQARVHEYGKEMLRLAAEAGSERGRAETAEARADALAGALKPFAHYYDLNDCEPHDPRDFIEVRIDDLRQAKRTMSALSAPAAEAGWKLVPAEPDNKMLQAAVETAIRADQHAKTVEECAERVASLHALEWTGHEAFAEGYHRALTDAEEAVREPLTEPRE